MIPLKEDKKNTPGPGTYNVKSSLEQPIVVMTEGADTKPFGSTTKRFVTQSNEAPAVGQYNDPRHAFETLRKLVINYN